MASEQFDESDYFNDEPTMMRNIVVPAITDAHDIDYDNFPSVVERYYTKHYYFRNDDIDEAHLLLKHSNGICLVGLADTHIAVKKGVKSINYDVGNFDRSKNKVSGKGKKGAMNLQPTSCLAIVTCQDGSEYRVNSVIQGKLVEVNELLPEKPELIGKDGAGFVAIVLPKLDKCKEQVALLANEEEYQAKLQQKNNEQVTD